MPLLGVSGVEKTYGARTVLKDISLQLQPGEKAGLVGPNGSGKTTLLKIITGELEADRGAVRLARGAAAGYLSQEPVTMDGGTLRMQLERPLRPLLELKRELGSLERQIAARSGKRQDGGLNSLLERYGELTGRFEAMDGYSAESRAMAVARGLGFNPSDLERETAGFSGGEKTRARLAALLLQQPDLLLLDEPTNFLDLAGVEWLEKFLRDWPGALVAVSHDRFFLDRIAARIFALQAGSIRSYPGNYSAYLAQRELERLENERAYQKQQALRAREERLIRESKADERSKRQARSRQKRLEKLEAVERPVEERTFCAGFDYSGRSGQSVITFDDVAKSFGPRTLFQGLSLEIRWGDRVALVGPNGAGKTTLLKLIAGGEAPSRGSIRLGPAVRVVYFKQEQEQLNPGLTLLDEIINCSELDLKQARNHLGGYLFRGDDVFKKVKELSGGEKSRLALARLALSGGNCLLMDEPTGHLDLPAVEELEKALRNYPGTLVVVSHDRYFLHNLANRVMELGPGGLRLYEGDFRAYLASRDGAAGPGGREQEEKEEARRQRREEHNRRRELQRREQRLREEQARLEQAVAAAEAAVARLEKALSDPGQYGDQDRLSELGAQLEAEKRNLSRCLQRWEEISLQLE